MKYFVTLLFGLFFLPTLVQAAPITFSAADLLGVQGVALPNGGPDSISGGSIRFNEPDNLAVLLSIPLDNVVENPLDFTVAINLTRLTPDFDPRFYISDGENLLGAEFADHDGGRTTAAFSSLSGNGLSIVEGSFEALSLGVGFPAVGGTFNAILSFQTTGLGTILTTDLFGVTATPSLAPVLNINNGLSLLLVSSSNSSTINPSSESYSFNSLTFDSTPVPAPPVMFLMAMGLALLGGRKRLFVA